MVDPLFVANVLIVVGLALLVLGMLAEPEMRVPLRALWLNLRYWAPCLGIGALLGFLVIGL